jgi:vancomycin resistance protein YoaR
MKDEAKSQLHKILVDYDAKLMEAERVEAAKRAAHAAFPERFLAFKTETIRPALEEMAEMLNERGHEATVRDQEESSSAVGGVKSAAVSLRVVPKPFARKSTETNPITIEVTFSANRSERKVTVSSTNTMASHGGSIGKRGEYEIDAVTVDVVANHVIQTLHEAFGGAR